MPGGAPMPDRRPGNGLPLFALTLLAGGVVAAVSVCADPPPDRRDFAGLYPQPFGELGDWLHTGLVEPLGAGAYVFLVGWVTVSIALIRGRRWSVWLMRIAGWALLTGCAALVADWIGPERISGPVAGSGGSVGAFASLWLDAHFQRAGAILVLVGAAWLGVLLTADHVVMPLFRFVRDSLAIVWRLLRLLLARRPKSEVRTKRDRDVSVRHFDRPVTTDTVVISHTPIPDDEPVPKLRLSYELPP